MPATPNLRDARLLLRSLQGEIANDLRVVADLFGIFRWEDVTEA